MYSSRTRCRMLYICNIQEWKYKHHLPEKQITAVMQVEQLQYSIQYIEHLGWSDRSDPVQLGSSHCSLLWLRTVVTYIDGLTRLGDLLTRVTKKKQLPSGISSNKLPVCVHSTCVLVEKPHVCCLKSHVGLLNPNFLAVRFRILLVKHHLLCSLCLEQWI